MRGPISEEDGGTTEEEMTPLKLRIALAEVQGWTYCKFSTARGIAVGYAPGQIDLGLRELPELTLDWVREIWMCLDRKQRITCSQKLREIVVRDGGHAASFNEDIIACCENATKEQRAEAILRTLGKWEEG